MAWANKIYTLQTTNDIFYYVSKYFHPKHFTTKYFIANTPISRKLYIYICIHIYVYIYMYTCIYIYIYIFIYILGNMLASPLHILLAWVLINLRYNFHIQIIHYPIYSIIWIVIIHDSLKTNWLTSWISSIVP